VKSASIRDSDATNITSPQQEHPEKCYTSRQIIFLQNEKNKKKVYKPVWLLGFRQITVTYQMLHYRNILTCIQPKHIAQLDKSLDNFKRIKGS